jgi:phage-related protein
MTRDLDLLKAFGVGLGPPKIEHIRGQVWELRSHGRSRHRVFYVAATGRRLVLLHAFKKKTPQTPPQEIQTARRRLRDYAAEREALVPEFRRAREEPRPPYEWRCAQIRARIAAGLIQQQLAGAVWQTARRHRAARTRGDSPKDRQ